MGRKKLSLQWISNDASRRATFKKRCQGLIKKTSELATLCGVKVCILVYGENEVQPHVWPSIPEAMNLLTSYKATEHLKHWNKKTSYEDFLKNRITKLQEQVTRFNHESQVHETSILLHESLAGHHPVLVGVNPGEVIRLCEVVEKKMMAIKERLQRHGIKPEQQQQPRESSNGPEPAEEPQKHQQNILMDLAQVVSGIFIGNSSSSGPSIATTSYGGGDIAQPYSQGGGPWNPFPSME